MNTPLSRKDLEALSAYLDGQLPPRQRQRLEARLQREAQLEAALEDLRSTRAALRSLPSLKAPRNFTLSPKMAGVPRAPARLYPAMRLASALASVLFVVVVLGDFLTSNALPALGPQPLALQERAVFESAPDVEATSPAQAPAAPEPLLEAAGEEAGVVEEAEDAVGEAFAEPLMEEEPAEEQFFADAGQAEMQAEEAPAEPAPLAAEALPTPEGDSLPTATFPPTPLAAVPVESPGEQEEDTVERIDPQIEQQPLVAPTQEDEKSMLLAEPAAVRPQFSFPLLRVLEIVLALIALVTGGIALATRRRY